MTRTADDRPASGDDRPVVLTLCTGNAARSVMAGAMLADAPVTIVTAGTHVLEGRPMSARTRDALATVGWQADSHRSHQLTEDDLERAQLIVAMASEHVHYIRRRHPDAAARTGSLKRLVRDLADDDRPLSERVAELELGGVVVDAWEDVEDPAGRDDDVYVACAKELDQLCAALLPRLG